MKDSKNLVIGMLCAVVCIMAVAYAAFSTTLTVKTTATVAQNWCVKIQSVSCNATPKAGGVSSFTNADNELVEVKATAETATNSLSTKINMTFIQPGDTATCTVKYENCGTLNALVTHQAFAGETALTVDSATGKATHSTDSIRFTINGLNNDTLSAKTETVTDTLDVVITGEYIDVEAGQGSANGESASVTIQSSASQSV